MHMRKKHMVEEVEKAMKEAGLGKELMKISDELDNASRTHKGQADRIRGLVGKAKKEGQQKPEKPEMPGMPGIKIVVNVGAEPKPMPMPMPMKKKMMKKVKGKKKNSRMAGNMEDALSGMY
tara:strand:+ start:389 stop:751 length:363 start_codon:yes stop_codon:yes gene_type:complete